LKYMVKVLRQGVAYVDTSPLRGEGLFGDGPALRKINEVPTGAAEEFIRFASR